MTTKLKVITSHICIRSIIIFFSIFHLHAYAETKITAQEGDTLLKLSKEYGIPLKELMHKNSFNDANKIIEGEVIIIPKKIYKSKDKEPMNYIVKEGDTLYKIARDYNVSINDIISVNNFDNASFLKPNQIILLPYGAKLKKVIDQNNKKIDIKKVNYHLSTKPEEISKIAQIHKVSPEDITNLNKLNNVQKINSNMKLKLREDTSLKWLKYGSLMINWSGWTYVDKNYITQAKNKRNRSFYLAISCEKRALNNTLKDSYWAKWYFPTTDFEFKLINDFCD